MLTTAFDNLLSKYTADTALRNQYRDEIEAAYTDEQRYFHTLSHLEHLYRELLPLQDITKDWDAVLIALFYHDFAYDVTQYVLANDNEERSAGKAADVLKTLGWSDDRIDHCTAHIIATKHHHAVGDNDTNLFTDADLCILGQPWDIYHAYLKAIRKEYVAYPDHVYHSGRVAVLKGFLKMENVYKTEHFRNLYEAAARENMEREIEILSLL